MPSSDYRSMTKYDKLKKVLLYTKLIGLKHSGVMSFGMFSERSRVEIGFIAVLYWACMWSYVRMCLYMCI